MTRRTIHTVLNYLIALVWIGNGLFCKVLNLVPRHREIVARILGEEYAPVLTTTIGVLEICMAIWILSRLFSRLSAAAQIGIVVLMNILEFLLVPDLLLHGRLNFVFAMMFVSTVYYNEFHLGKNLN